MNRFWKLIAITSKRRCFSSGTSTNDNGIIMKGVLPEKPIRPLESNCCGNGCALCVWEIYDDEVKKYNVNFDFLLLQSTYDKFVDDIIAETFEICSRQQFATGGVWVSRTGSIFGSCVVGVCRVWKKKEQWIIITTSCRTRITNHAVDPETFAPNKTPTNEARVCVCSRCSFNVYLFGYRNIFRIETTFTFVDFWWIS